MPLLVRKSALEHGDERASCTRVNRQMVLALVQCRHPDFAIGDPYPV